MKDNKVEPNVLDKDQIFHFGVHIFFVALVQLYNEES